MNQTHSDTRWPDGTPRSRGNAFDVLYRSRHAPGSAEQDQRRKAGAKHGRALPFSLPGTRARTR